MKVLVTGVIGSDTHIVGNRILSMALEKAGYKVITLGALTPAGEFVKAAVETNADAIMVSSLYGQGELDCRGFRDLCVEAGLDDILLYVGGNLVVGKQSWPEVEERFLAMGFDRAAPPGTRIEAVIEWLARDFAARRRDAMATAALLIDFGSTYTKLRAVDLGRRRIPACHRTRQRTGRVGCAARCDSHRPRAGGFDVGVVHTRRPNARRRPHPGFMASCVRSRSYARA